MKKVKTEDIKEVKVVGTVVEVIGWAENELCRIDAENEEFVSFLVNDINEQRETEEYVMIEVDDVNVVKIKTEDIKDVKVNGIAVEIIDYNDKVILTIDAGFEDFVSFIVNDIVEQMETEQYVTVVLP